MGEFYAIFSLKFGAVFVDRMRSREIGSPALLWLFFSSASIFFLYVSASVGVASWALDIHLKPQSI